MAEINKKYCIYRRHLKNSNKNYIGYTSLTLNQRAGRNGRKYASCSKHISEVINGKRKTAGGFHWEEIKEN